MKASIIRLTKSCRAFQLVCFSACVCLMSATAWAQVLAQGQLNACDLNSDGVVNSTDVTLAANMTVGLTTPCTANIVGVGVCNAVAVQRVIDSALGGSCVAGNPHTVTLNWTASVSPNIVTYNIYRGATSTGPFTKIGSVAASLTTYVDTTSLAGETYFYVATAVDSNNNESAYSAAAQAIVSFP